MKIKRFLRGKYLRSIDFPEPATVTVSGVSEKKFERGQEKVVLHFEGLQKPLVMNDTNLLSAMEVFGSDDSDDWVSKRIEIYNDPNVEFEGKSVGGLRLRAPNH